MDKHTEKLLGALKRIANCRPIRDLAVVFAIKEAMEMVAQIEAEIAGEENRVECDWGCSHIGDDECMDPYCPVYKLSPKAQLIRAAKRLITALNLPKGGGVAMDECGEWSSHDVKPRTGIDSWIDEGGLYCCVLHATALSDWPDDWKTSWIDLDTPEVEG